MREETGLAVLFTDVIFTPLHELTPSQTLVFFPGFRSRVLLAVTARTHRAPTAIPRPWSLSHQGDCQG